jgi:hypothetical protein
VSLEKCHRGILSVCQYTLNTFKPSRVGHVRVCSTSHTWMGTSHFQVSAHGGGKGGVVEGQRQSRQLDFTMRRGLPLRCGFKALVMLVDGRVVAERMPYASPYNCGQLSGLGSFSWVAVLSTV